MSLGIDLKYAHLLSPKFERFQRKGDNLFNVRCPLCGDSHKNKSKMRGYIYRKINDLFYKCHNCGAGMSLGSLIKQLDPELHKEYIMERYKSGENGNSNFKAPKNIFPKTKFGKITKQVQYDNAERCDKLPSQHFCIEYLKGRNIPEQYYSKLLYTNNFKLFCDEINPTHGKTLTEDKRLIIPFYDEYNELIAVSGRALEASDYTLRYVTVRVVDSDDKLIYGMDRVNLSKPIYLVEGPVDSLFLDNCVASADANLSVTAKTIKSNDITLVFDNEPRNKNIVNLMQNAIKDGYKIVIWPDNVVGKDINEMYNNGIDVKSVIDSNTYKELKARMQLHSWKKV